MKYVCITKCTWGPAHRLWEVGQVTEDLPKDVKPPEHFRPIVAELEVPAPVEVKKPIEDPLSAAGAGERVAFSEVTAGKRAR